ITGATSGIGRSYAEAFAARGYDLLLTGRRAEQLNGLCAELEQRYRIHAHRRFLELTDRGALERFVQEVAALSQPAVLINNAGFGRSSAFGEDDVDAQTGMVTVHVEATLRLTHAVIPRMVARRAGWIINVSSLASYLPVPRGAVYVSTKAFVTSFTESIALELAPHGIRCQALLPGFTRTDFHRDPQYGHLDRRNRGLIRWMEAAEVVDVSIRSIERNRRLLCVPGFSNRVLFFIARHIPRPLLHYLVKRTRVDGNTGGRGGAGGAHNRSGGTRGGGGSGQ
ncbi:MAG: SDR family NAD(P)-dependent oxidoreductase, partial [Spirochaetota bacterium]